MKVKMVFCRSLRDVLFTVVMSVVMSLFPQGVMAQDDASDRQIDSLQAVNDSLVQHLRNQVQELELQLF